MTDQTACMHCEGSGKLPMYSYEPAPKFSHYVRCPICGGSGSLQDVLRREHENGDADGLGFFRGCFNLLAAVLGSVATLYVLVRYLVLPYIPGL